MNLLQSTITYSKFYNEATNEVEELRLVWNRDIVHIYSGETLIGSATCDTLEDGKYTYNGYNYNLLLEVVDSIFTDGKVIVYQ